MALDADVDRALRDARPIRRIVRFAGDTFGLEVTSWADVETLNWIDLRPGVSGARVPPKDPKHG